jgi:hypothetical protein
MLKLEVAYTDDRKGIQLLQVTFPDGRTLHLTPLLYNAFFEEAEKVIDQAMRMEKMVRETDWTKGFPCVSDQR